MSYISSAIQWQHHQLRAVVAAHLPAWSVLGCCRQYEILLFGICHKITSVAASDLPEIWKSFQIEAVCSCVWTDV